MSKHLSISEARAKLFELMDYVNREGAVVVIEHRDRSERAVLLSEARLKFLETHLRALKKQRGKPFTLAGSISSALSDADLEVSLAELKTEQQHLATVKADTLLGD